MHQVFQDAGGGLPGEALDLKQLCNHTSIRGTKPSVIQQGRQIWVACSSKQFYCIKKIRVLGEKKKSPDSLKPPEIAKINQTAFFHVTEVLLGWAVFCEMQPGPTMPDEDTAGSGILGNTYPNNKANCPITRHPMKLVSRLSKTHRWHRAHWNYADSCSRAQAGWDTEGKLTFYRGGLTEIMLPMIQLYSLMISSFSSFSSAICVL